MPSLTPFLLPMPSPPPQTHARTDTMADTVAKLQAQIQSMKAANSAGGPTGALGAYYQKHIRTGSFRPVLHMMSVLVVTGIAVETFAHNKAHENGDHGGH
jgi:hypothetical protein